MAFRLAEDYDIQLPVMVNYDGFYISYLAEGVRIPGPGRCRPISAVLKTQPQRTIMDPSRRSAPVRTG